MNESMNENRLIYLLIYLFLPIHAILDDSNVNLCMLIAFPQQTFWALSSIYTHCIDLIVRNEMHFRSFGGISCLVLPQQCAGCWGMVRE